MRALFLLFLLVLAGCLTRDQCLNLVKNPDFRVPPSDTLAFDPQDPVESYYAHSVTSAWKAVRQLEKKIESARHFCRTADENEYREDIGGIMEGLRSSILMAVDRVDRANRAALTVIDHLYRSLKRSGVEYVPGEPIFQLYADVSTARASLYTDSNTPLSARASAVRSALLEIYYLSGGSLRYRTARENAELLLSLLPQYYFPAYLSSRIYSFVLDIRDYEEAKDYFLHVMPHVETVVNQGVGAEGSLYSEVSRLIYSYHRYLRLEDERFSGYLHSLRARIKALSSTEIPDEVFLLPARGVEPKVRGLNLLNPSLSLAVKTRYLLFSLDRAENLYKSRDVNYLTAFNILGDVNKEVSRIEKDVQELLDLVRVERERCREEQGTDDLYLCLNPPDGDLERCREGVEDLRARMERDGFYFSSPDFNDYPGCLRYRSLLLQAYSSSPLYLEVEDLLSQIDTLLLTYAPLNPRVPDKFYVYRAYGPEEMAGKLSTVKRDLVKMLGEIKGRIRGLLEEYLSENLVWRGTEEGTEVCLENPLSLPYDWAVVEREVPLEGEGRSEHFYLSGGRIYGEVEDSWEGCEVIPVRYRPEVSVEEVWADETGALLSFEIKGDGTYVHCFEGVVLSATGDVNGNCVSFTGDGEALVLVEHPFRVEVREGGIYVENTTPYPLTAELSLPYPHGEGIDCPVEGGTAHCLVSLPPYGHEFFRMGGPRDLEYSVEPEEPAVEFEGEELEVEDKGEEEPSVEEAPEAEEGGMEEEKKAELLDRIDSLRRMKEQAPELPISLDSLERYREMVENGKLDYVERALDRIERDVREYAYYKAKISENPDAMKAFADGNYVAAVSMASLSPEPSSLPLQVLPLVALLLFLAYLKFARPPAPPKKSLKLPKI